MNLKILSTIFPFLLLTVVCGSLASSQYYGEKEELEKSHYRDPKRMYLPFIKVIIPPEPCGSNGDSSTGPNGQTIRDGVCLPRGKCEIAKGNKGSDCAKGFGECCRFQASCNSTNTDVDLYQEVTELTSTNAVNDCTFTIRKKSKYCQVKLDFVSYVSQSANFNGTCGNDSLSISGSPTVVQGFQVCGTLTGQHMYLAFGKSESIELRPSFANSPGQYRIIVTQIPCISPLRVPDHCLQYFNTTKGMVKSFDWPNQQQNHQEYAICVGGISGGGTQIAWRQCSQGNQNPFLINGPGIMSTPRCELDDDWVQINGHNRMCTFPNNTDITSNYKPFLLNVHFNAREFVEFPFMNEIAMLDSANCATALATNPLWGFWYSECYWDATITTTNKCRCDLKVGAVDMLGSVDTANTGFCLEYHQK